MMREEEAMYSRSSVLLRLTLTMIVAAQNDVPQPSVSKDPLTDEQVAVYRAVLQDYLKDSKDSLNLADKTEVLEGAWTSFDGSCPKNHVQDVTQSSHPIVHRFSPTTVLDKRIVIVDPSEQQKKIDKGDPQNLVKRAIDDHVPVSDTELDDSIKQAFKQGVFSLSEIMFDKKHQRALVSYSFVCGSLCGNGNTMILTKAKGNWRVSKTCSSWVS
jgi:hypothetical protein